MLHLPFSPPPAGCRLRLPFFLCCRKPSPTCGSDTSLSFALPLSAVQIDFHLFAPVVQALAVRVSVIDVMIHSAHLNR